MSAPLRSAGLLMYRRSAGALEVLLVHPGGPFFARKDAGAWTVPKGLVDAGEDALDAAVREFVEETSFEVCTRDFLALGEVRQKGGKTVVAWAFEGDCDPAQLASNTVAIEWPPKSGRWQEVPEVDRAAWCDLGSARVRINPAQIAFLDRLSEALAERGG